MSKKCNVFFWVKVALLHETSKAENRGWAGKVCTRGRHWADCVGRASEAFLSSQSDTDLHEKIFVWQNMKILWFLIISMFQYVDQSYAWHASICLSSSTSS